MDANLQLPNSVQLDKKEIEFLFEFCKIDHAIAKVIDNGRTWGNPKAVALAEVLNKKLRGEPTECSEIYEAVLKEFGPTAVEAMGLPKNATFEDIKKRMLWGTYGKYQEYMPARLVRLIDCESAHLQAILDTQMQLPKDGLIRKICESILADRKL